MMESFTPPIPPVPSQEGQPLWSVMIPTYNCASYLRDTLASVLAQDPGREKMQIEVVDDCSTADDPGAVVAEMAGSRVRFFQQPGNVGHVRNFNTCLEHSRGRLVHLLHGDDAVRPGFYQVMQSPFVDHPEIGAAFCRDIRMDEKGHWQNISPLLQTESGIMRNWLEMIAAGQRLQAPAMVVRREVYEQLGGFDRRIAYYGEDWEMWVRIAASYPVWYEVEPFALYRLRSASLSGKTVRSGENGRDLRRAIEINRAHLPQKYAAEWTKKARESFAFACLRRAHRMVGAGIMQGPLEQAQEALRTSLSPLVIAKAAYLFIRWAWRRAFNPSRPASNPGVDA